MRNFVVAASIIAALALAAPSARADWVGAAAGAGTGLIVAGPFGAVAGAVIGGVFGKPFWGPPIGRDACWVDDYFHRHCNEPAYLEEGRSSAAQR
jgi:hypothetical protein